MRVILSLWLALLFAAPLSISETEAQTKFKLGVIAPLSGPLAEYGTAVRNGMELAEREKPGLLESLDIVFEDDQYDGRKTIAAFGKLRESDKADLIYVWGTGPGHAVGPIAQRMQYPIVTITMDPAPAIEMKWMVRFANYSEQFVQLTLKHLRKRGLKKIGIIRTELGYIDSMVTALAANLRPDEQIEDVASLQPGEMDFKSIVLRLQNKQYDALAVFLMTGQIAEFYREAGGKIRLPLTFGTDFFESTTEIRSAGAAIEGAVFPNNSVEPWFASSYRAAFGDDSQITFAANAYDFVIMAAELFGHSATADRSPAEVLKRLREAAPRKGSSGSFSFVDSAAGGQYFDFPLVMRQVRNGEAVTISD